MSRSEQRPGSINLSTNAGAQRHLIEGSIQRVVEDRDQNRTEDSDRKQSSQTGDRVINPRGNS